MTRTNAAADALSRYHGRPRSTARSRRSSPRHFLPQILQGNSAPQQRAAGHIPRKHTGDLNQSPPAAGVFLASAAGARWKRSLAMCAEDDVRPGARYCDKALPRRTVITRLRTPPVITPTPGSGPSVADRQRQPMAVNARPEWRTEQPVRRDRGRLHLPGHAPIAAATCAGARRLRSLSVTSFPSTSVLDRQSSRLPTGHMPRAPVLPCLRRSTLSAA